MLGGGGENEFPLPHTQQVVDAHQAQNAFVIQLPALANQFGMHATIAVGRPAQRDALDLVSQLHSRGLGFVASPEAVVSSPTQAGDPAEAAHMILRIGGFPDLLVDPPPPLATAPRGCSLKRCKTFVK